MPDCARETKTRRGNKRKGERKEIRNVKVKRRQKERKKEIRLEKKILPWSK
jgi:hypothetical protein